MITASQLKSIAPLCKHVNYLDDLNKAMDEVQINTPLRQAAFLAQILHESCNLNYLEEIASGEAYEGRKDLGNTQKGDGKRYKGRGFIQLTGRSNYIKAGTALHLDLVGMPELAATPAIASRVACWYWTTHGCNALADKSDFDAITRKVNGGLNGKQQRDSLYKMALSVLS